MKTHKILLVDASGSMSLFVNDTKKTIKSIIEKLDTDTHFNLIYFDSEDYNVVADDWKSFVPHDAADKYYARGNTPITDSVYKAIQDTTNEIDDIESLSEPHKVIIFTDGQENDSRHVKSEDLGRAVDHFSSMFGWDFQFIGPKSCEDSIKNYTETIKIKKENVSLYADMKEGLRMMEQKTIN